MVSTLPTPCLNNLICINSLKYLVMNENLNFGQAIEALKQGKIVSRKGWNGKGMFLFLTTGTVPKQHDLRHPVYQSHFKEQDEVVINSHIDMRAADGSVVVGWLASQTDMLSEDWMIID